MRTTSRCAGPGPFTMVECDIAAAPWISLQKAHELANRVESSVKERHSRVDSVFVHVEPSRKKSVSAVFPVSDMKGLDSRLHGHFGQAPYFLVVRLGPEGVEIEDVYRNESLSEPGQVHVGVRVARAIIGHGADVVFAVLIGEISFHMLKDRFIDVLHAGQGTTARETIEKYRRGEVTPLITPHPSEESEIETRKIAHED